MQNYKIFVQTQKILLKKIAKNFIFKKV